MYSAYKRTLTPADRVIFEMWLLGIATFYGALALLVVFAIAIGHTIGVDTQGDVAAINMPSPSSPRSDSVASSTSLGLVLFQQER